MGSSTPTNLIIIPFINEGEVIGVAELASFKVITKKEEEILNKIFSKLAVKIMAGAEVVKSKKKLPVVQ